MGQSFVGLFIYFFIKWSLRAWSIGYARSLPCPAAQGEGDKEIYTLGTTGLQGVFLLFLCCSLGLEVRMALERPEAGLALG